MQAAEVPQSARVLELEVETQLAGDELLRVCVELRQTLGRTRLRWRLELKMGTLKPELTEADPSLDFEHAGMFWEWPRARGTSAVGTGSSIAVLGRTIVGPGETFVVQDPGSVEQREGSSSSVGFVAAGKPGGSGNG